MLLFSALLDRRQAPLVVVRLRLLATAAACSTPSAAQGTGGIQNHSLVSQNFPVPSGTAQNPVASVVALTCPNPGQKILGGGYTVLGGAGGTPVVTGANPTGGVQDGNTPDYVVALVNPTSGVSVTVYVVCGE